MTNVLAFTEPLRLQARQWPMVQGGGGLVALAVGTALFEYLRYGGLGWATLTYVLVLAALGALITLGGLVPVTLIADDVGLHWSQFLFRRTYLWAEISSIGVGRSKISEPSESRVGRVLAKGQRFGPGPSIGINLRKAEAEPGKAAYRRGFTGYDMDVRADFKRGLRSIAEELQQRLEMARLKDDRVRHP